MPRSMWMLSIIITCTWQNLELWFLRICWASRASPIKRWVRFCEHATCHYLGQSDIVSCTAALLLRWQESRTFPKDTWTTFQDAGSENMWCYFCCLSRMDIWNPCGHGIFRWIRSLKRRVSPAKWVLWPVPPGVGKFAMKLAAKLTWNYGTKSGSSVSSTGSSKDTDVLTYRFGIFLWLREKGDFFILAYAKPMQLHTVCHCYANLQNFHGILI